MKERQVYFLLVVVIFSELIIILWILIPDRGDFIKFSNEIVIDTFDRGFHNDWWNRPPDLATTISNTGTYSHSISVSTGATPLSTSTSSTSTSTSTTTTVPSEFIS